MKYFKKPNYKLCKWDLLYALWWVGIVPGMVLQGITLGWFRYYDMGSDIIENVYQEELRWENERAKARLERQRGN
jgi:hypothetical protein